MSQGKLVAGRYRPLKKLGRRALGDAFTAQDTQLDRAVMLQTLQGPMLAEGVAGPPAAVGRSLRHDILAWVPLQNPHLMNILDAQLDGRPPLLVIEPLEGDSLVRWVPGARLRGETLEAALEEVTDQLLSALGALHDAGLTHKDIRPASVLRSARGDFVLLEPGFPRGPEVDAALHPGVIAQTAPFMAPEVLRGEPHTPASDLYQLGALLRFVATGAPPFASPEQAVLAASQGQGPAPMAEVLPDLREAWRIFLDELCAPDVSRRIAGVAAATEFRQMMQMEEAAIDAAPAAARPGPPPGGGSWVRPAVFVACALAGGAALWVNRPRPPEVVTLETDAVTGLDALELTWRAVGDVAAPAFLTLKSPGRPPEKLAVKGDRYHLSLPRAAVTSAPFELVDPAGQTVASDQFPGVIHPLKVAVTRRYAPDGSQELRVQTSRDVSLKGAYQRGKTATRVEPTPAGRTHTVTLDPGYDEGITALKLEVTGPLGAVRPVEVPAEVAAHKPFFKAVMRRVRGFIPKPVAAALTDAVAQAKDQAVRVRVPGWEELKRAWDDDPDFTRLREQGALFFGDRERFDPELLHYRYLDFETLERANTVVVALTPHRPLETRRIYEAYCRAFVPPSAEGKAALAPGTGSPIMMQYDGAPPSWLNEDGKKKWPASFKTPFALKPDFYKPGTLARFTLLVEDATPLYRVELRLTFPGEDEEVERGFWFYPRRDMNALAAKEVEGKALMALEVPTWVIPDRIGTLAIEVDKLGRWGGHGGTTFEELRLAKIAR